MAKAKSTPEWQRLIERCQKLWEAYDKAPTKKRLEAFGAHLEKMKVSKSVKVKAERTRGARAFRQQWKAAGYHMAAKKKASKTKSGWQRIPHPEFPRHTWSPSGTVTYTLKRMYGSMFADQHEYVYLVTRKGPHSTTDILHPGIDAEHINKLSDAKAFAEKDFKMAAKRKVSRRRNPYRGGESLDALQTRYWEQVGVLDRVRRAVEHRATVSVMRSTGKMSEGKILKLRDAKPGMVVTVRVLEKRTGERHHVAIDKHVALKHFIGMNPWLFDRIDDPNPPEDWLRAMMDGVPNPKGRAKKKAKRKTSKRKRNPESVAWRWPFMGNKAEGTMTVEELEAIADSNIPLKRLAVKDAEHIEKLKEDIQLRGFVNPVIVKVGRGMTPMILDGHHRVIVARQLGIKDVPVVYYKANPGKSKRNPADSWRTQRDVIAEKYGLDKFQSSHHPKDQHLSVDLISVPKQGRGEGRASMAMRDTLDWADANGVTVTVSPTSEFGSSKGRLEKWYRSMGFVSNKGRNKDFRFTDSMLRIPMAPNPRKAKRKAKRNPIHHSPRHEQEIHVLDEAGWHVILEPSSIEGPDEAGINAVKLVDPDNEDYYALITRSARDPGQWQATRFDERGPVGHSTRDTLIEAVNDTRKWYGLTVSEVVQRKS